MSRTGLTNVSSIPDPALAWNFDFLFPTIPGASSTTQLTYRCMTTQLPGSTIEEVDVNLHGINLKYAGRRNWTHSFTSQFLEAIDWQTRAIFYNWMESARSWVNNSGSQSSSYKVTAQVVTYTDAPAVSQTYNIVGLWPTQIADITFDGAQGGQHVALDITWAYDYTDG